MKHVFSAILILSLASPVLAQQPPPPIVSPLQPSIVTRGQATMTGIRFDVRNRDALERDALRQAVADARAPKPRQPAPELRSIGLSAWRKNQITSRRVR